MKEQQLLT